MTQIGVDETAFKKRHDYVTIGIADMASGHVAAFINATLESLVLCMAMVRHLRPGTTLMAEGARI